MVTRRALAAELGVVQARITKWELDGAPVALRGDRGKPSLFDREAFMAWLKAQGKGQRAGTDLPADRAARARESTAKAALAEQTLQVRRGAYLPVVEIEAALLVFHEGVATAVQAFPRLAHRLVVAAKEGGAEAVAEILEQAVQEVLGELSTWRAQPR